MDFNKTRHRNLQTVRDPVTYRQIGLVVAAAFVRVIRYRIVIQVPAHLGHCFVQHLRLTQSAPTTARPVSKIVQVEPKLLSAGAPFELKE